MFHPTTLWTPCISKRPNPEKILPLFVSPFCGLGEFLPGRLSAIVTYSKTNKRTNSACPVLSPVNASSIHQPANRSPYRSPTYQRLPFQTCKIFKLRNRNMRCVKRDAGKMGKCLRDNAYPQVPKLLLVRVERSPIPPLGIIFTVVVVQYQPSTHLSKSFGPAQ